VSRRTDGTYRCDVCDVDVGNGSVHQAAVIVDLDPDVPYQTRQLHLCRINGHAAQLLSAEALPAWTATRS
jgi:hypothetical protein